MDRVFIVTTGEYSSYQMECAFSTRAKAQQFIDEYDDWAGYEHPRVEALPLDTWQRRVQERYWKVELRDGNTDVLGRPVGPTTDVRELTPDYRVPDDIPLGVSLVPWGYEVILTAPDAESAVKIAAERVATAKAQRAGI